MNKLSIFTNNMIMYNSSYSNAYRLKHARKSFLFLKELRRSLCCSRVSRKKEAYESVVGLEVHAQILSSSKIFSGAATKFISPINSTVSLFDCAIPGTLPVLNKKSVEAAAKTAIALNSEINLVSEFDRKHYFYADMPAGYQITQQRIPFASNGSISFVVYNPANKIKPYRKVGKLKQIQLEQDSARSIHDQTSAGSLIDLNRAGVGLMEFVFEPDLENGEEAAALVMELSRILSAIGVCNCKMEEGALRVDANVSVNKIGDEPGTRTEIKNLNSLRSIVKSIDYEICRQQQVLENGEKVVNETRSYDVERKITLPMRDKEAKQDYRYMPEPNLPPLRLTEKLLAHWKECFKTRTPEDDRNSLVQEYGLNLELVTQIVNGGNLQFFSRVMRHCPHLPVLKVCNFLLTDLLGLLNKDRKTIDDCPISPEIFGEILDCLNVGLISHKTCQRLIREYYGGETANPRQIIKERDLAMIDDEAKIEELCRELLASNQDLVISLKSGKKKAFDRLVDRLSKVGNGRLDMKQAIGVLKRVSEKDV